MDDLAFLHERIESYADYTNDRARILTDEQVRAYVGEALARVIERLAPSGGVAEALNAVLLRCQFADQRVVRTLDDGTLDASAIGQLHAVDRELTSLADRTTAIEAGGVGELVRQIDATLDRRATILIDGGVGDGAAPR